MDTNLAYVAGLIDGEGCIHLDMTGNTCKARVSVGMTEPALPILRELHEQWGGTLYQMRKATAKWAAAWTWHLTSVDAEMFLVEIRPFLRLKAPQADLAVEVQIYWRALPKRTNGSAIWGPGTAAQKQEFRNRMSALNARGPRVPASTVEVA